MTRRRRRRQPDSFEFLLELAVPVVGLILLLGLFAPLLLKAIEQLILIIVVCVVIVSVSYFVIRSFVQNKSARSTSTPPSTTFRAEAPKSPVYLNPYPEVTWPKPDPPRAPSLEERLRAIDWFQFEKVVNAIYEVPGCTVRRMGGAKPDGGIDLIAEQNGRRIVVQCKHWRKWTVGVRHVRELLGSMTDAKAEKGVLVTLRGCTQDARALADKHGIVIIDGAGLVKLMKMSDGSIDQRILAMLDDTRKYCPKCESQLVMRTAGRGPKQGTQFWGCSNYPRCRYILRNA